MKKIYLILLCITLSACASATRLEEASLEPGVIYKFSSNTLLSSLYVKFLPAKDNVNALLFKTANNAERVTALELGLPGVLYQDRYSVTGRGKVSFRYFDEGLFEELLRNHQYASSGGQDENVAMFRYRLDFRRAVKLQ